MAGIVLPHPQAVGTAHLLRPHLEVIAVLHLPARLQAPAALHLPVLDLQLLLIHTVTLVLPII